MLKTSKGSGEAHRRPARGLLRRTIPIIATFALVTASSAGVVVFASLTSSAGATSTMHYIANEAGAYATTTALGYNVHDVSLNASQISTLPAGTQGLAYVGIDKTTCALPTQAFKDFVLANSTNDKLYGYYLMDEPGDTNCVTTIKAHADFIRANAPAKKSFIELVDKSGLYAAYAPSKSDVDLVGIDPYPCSNGTCNYPHITSEVNAVVTAGIPLADIVPTFQVFGNSYYNVPTATQLQTILDTWQADVPNPQMEYSYSWGTQGGSLSAALSTQPALQTVMAAHNSGAVPTTTTTPPPETTTTTTPPLAWKCPYVANPVAGQTLVCTFE
jgi:hypothetical protein